MRWAPLYCRPPILRGVSASQIRADHAANQARINARYGPALPSSPQLRGEADAAHHSDVISHACERNKYRDEAIPSSPQKWRRTIRTKCFEVGRGEGYPLTYRANLIDSLPGER